MAYERILRRFRECVRRHDYVLTIHAEEEMSADGLSIVDVECGVLTGKILEKQRDDRTGESKYRILGRQLLVRRSSWLQDLVRQVQWSLLPWMLHNAFGHEW